MTLANRLKIVREGYAKSIVQRFLEIKFLFQSTFHACRDREFPIRMPARDLQSLV